MIEPPQAANHLSFHPLPGMPDITPGVDLANLLAAALDRAGLEPRGDDVLLVAQKAVSKMEGLIVNVRDVTPSARARQLAEETGKDPGFLEVVLGESRAVVAARRGVVITEHVSGAVMANAGVDRSNVAGSPAGEVCLLPRDPDLSAETLRRGLVDIALCRDWDWQPAVIITDSWGRPFRLGTVGFALGAAGLATLCDLRGREDRYGRALETSDLALADALAAAADLVMGQADEGTPAVLARGVRRETPEGSARDLLRQRSEDLFR